MCLLFVNHSYSPSRNAVQPSDRNDENSIMNSDMNEIKIILTNIVDRPIILKTISNRHPVEYVY